MSVGPLENNNFVATGPALEAGGVAAAGSFDENLDSLMEKLLVAFVGQFVDLGEEAGVTFFAEFLRHLVGHRRGRSVFAGRIFKEVGVVELDLADECHRLFEVFVRFPGKANDNIGGEADAGVHRPEFLNDAEEAIAGVAAVHELQDAVAAALERDVGAFAELGEATVGFGEVIAIPFGVRRSEADSFETIDCVHGIEQLDESGSAVTDRDFAFAVAGDDLSKKGDFLITLRNKLAALGDDLFDGTAAFLAAGKGDDAEGAVLVAALHDADKAGDLLAGMAVYLAVAQAGKVDVFLDRAFAALFRLDIDDRIAPASEQVIHVIGGAMKFLRADDEIDTGSAEEFVTARLSHAAEITENRVGPALFGLVGEFLHFADGFLLGLVADAAGVEEHDIGFLFGRSKRIAFGDELGGDGFGVALVHLTAIGFDVNTRHCEEGLK